QQLEGNFIYPKVVGNSVGLPSIWVLVAVTVGGSAMGIVGMLIFIPLCSVLYALLRQSVFTRLKAKGIEPHHSPEKKPVEEVREQVDPPVDG
ncbi:MAG: AI-2E family transporter, partial [Angelakisella sp.]|nr:AI-2E family transporter [Angelakisella sp.]